MGAATGRTGAVDEVAEMRLRWSSGMGGVEMLCCVLLEGVVLFRVSLVGSRIRVE